ncbi:hypothetical protein DC522_31550 [Microvirga sp. KLBC 81]|nr:hypothetical protein DC522_31550 [Microvirga sp. KLBC 81]
MATARLGLEWMNGLGSWETQLRALGPPVLAGQGQTKRSNHIGSQSMLQCSKNKSVRHDTVMRHEHEHAAPKGLTHRLVVPRTPSEPAPDQVGHGRVQGRSSGEAASSPHPGSQDGLVHGVIARAGKICLY